MKAILARPWIGPDGERYLAGEHAFPASFADKLPSSAQVVEEPEEKVEKPKPSKLKPTQEAE